MKKGGWGLYASKTALRMLQCKKRTTYKICRSEDNTETYLEETACEEVDFSYVFRSGKLQAD